MVADTNRSRSLIDALGLMPHPEGGYFAEIFRSPLRISVTGTAGGSVERSALSTIYFLLTHPEFSCWHIVGRDELWHFYEGHPLELLTVDPARMVLERRVLGPHEADQSPVLAVPAGHWQAARPLSSYTLAGCTVGPGFEFDDLTLLREDPVASEKLRQSFPETTGLL